MLDFFLPRYEKKLKAELRNILGFVPGNLFLYKQAFRHNSVARQIKGGIKNSNERLEFLGDAVLSIVIAEFLFRKFPYKDEGFLTKMRSKIVSRDHFNQLSRKLGLLKFLELSNDPGLQYSSMHGDAFEALIGAIYLDKGFAFTQKFIHYLLRYHVDVDKLLETETDFKSRLIEWAQREKQDLQFSMLEVTGRGYEKLFTIAALLNKETIAKAQHISKKKAEQLAAETACQKLGIA